MKKEEFKRAIDELMDEGEATSEILNPGGHATSDKQNGIR